MRDYIIRRVLLLIPIIVGITLFLFILTNVILDPVSVYIRNPQQAKFIDAIRAQHGLDRPLYERYFIYLYNLFTGNWGTAASDANNPVLYSISTRFGATLQLTVAAMFFIIALGIPTGIISATKKDKPVDQTVRIVALSGISLPTFWFGLLVQYFFAFLLHKWGLPYLPSSGLYSPTVDIFHLLPRITGIPTLDALLSGNWNIFIDTVSHLILPAFTLAFVGFGVLTRIVRAAMLEVLRQDYITLARSKGLSERVVIYKHALRNAMIPTLTLIGLFFAGLLGGAVITETIFALNGIGRFAAQAVILNDTDSVLGFTVLVSFIYVLGNLIVDLLYAYTDPRIRLS